MMKFRKNILSASIVAISLYASAPVLLADDHKPGHQSPEIGAAQQESRIDTTFELNRYLRSYDLDVSVADGKATLAGIVDEDITRDLAGEIALSVAGVESVDNRIEVQEEHAKKASGDNERGFGETVDDASITAAVKSRLLWNSQTEGLKTEVSTHSGVVTLSGIADSDETIELANKLAKNTHGVASVTNRLTVDADAKAPRAADAKEARSEKGKTAQAISDTWITTKVKSTFIMSSNVSSGDISVSTEDGIVSLSGSALSGEERDLAIALATNIRGVQSVNSDNVTL